MKRMNVKMSKAEANQMLNEVDDDGNGNIDFHEVRRGERWQSVLSVAYSDLVLPLRTEL